MAISDGNNTQSFRTEESLSLSSSHAESIYRRFQREHKVRFVEKPYPRHDFLLAVKLAIAYSGFCSGIIFTIKATVSFMSLPVPLSQFGSQYIVKAT